MRSWRPRSDRPGSQWAIGRRQPLTILYVTEQGAAISKRSRRIVVSKARQELDQISLAELEQVVLLGNVNITSPALRCLLAKGIDLALLSYSGKYLGRLSSGASRNIDLRRTQFRKLDDPVVVLDLAKRFVGGKIRNLRTHLGRHQRTHPDDRLARAMVSLRRSFERLEAAADLAAVLGHEGQASAAYFGAFGMLLRAEGITFERRLRRPPPDPTNILLSFGYTMVGNVMQGYVELSGLDPYLGALHRPEYGRPSLALDLIEEFRSLIVDMTVVRVINTRAITPRDFVFPSEEDAPVEDEWERAEVDQEGGKIPRRILLTPLGAKTFLAAFERRLRDRVVYPPTGMQLTYRQVMQEQVYLLARHLKGEATYLPFEANS